MKNLPNATLCFSNCLNLAIDHFAAIYMDVSTFDHFAATYTLCVKLCNAIFMCFLLCCIIYLSSTAEDGGEDLDLLGDS